MNAWRKKPVWCCILLVCIGVKILMNAMSFHFVKNALQTDEACSMNHLSHAP